MDWNLLAIKINNDLHKLSSIYNKEYCVIEILNNDKPKKKPKCSVLWYICIFIIFIILTCSIVWVYLFNKNKQFQH